MVGSLMSTIFDAIVDFGEMIFDLLDKVGAIQYIVAFSIIGLFVSFIILNRLKGSYCGSDSVLPSGRVEQSQRFRDTERAEWNTSEDWINNGW